MSHKKKMTYGLFIIVILTLITAIIYSQNTKYETYFGYNLQYVKDSVNYALIYNFPSLEDTSKLVDIRNSINLIEQKSTRKLNYPITDEEIKTCQVTSDELSEISSYIKGVSGTVASVFMYEKTPGTFKVSMRSDDLVDVSEVATKFGGGGHMRAAGCTVNGNAEKILEDVLSEIEKKL